ncbi:SNO glutamine amidotransferase [Rhizoclosmatium globosum]|uniref:glutaminase n=1 Tax=Rhizoclosmatium globosum TaxID=329046 RepID=A0A1Y2BVZ7_9FUNG|nr:SNO glutamine amidotransferase [Rhizoclosmatium globosum]|eukprot:ORY38844.1 SNO glutamine amidotransferase [Rhizoclosmatium globosum]
MSQTTSKATIGVVALQGAFSEHIFMLQRLPQLVASTVEIRSAQDFEKYKDSIDGIVLPGGESTTMSIILERETGLAQGLKQWIQDGKPIWGTCAGLIMLSDVITSTKQGGQTKLGGLRTTVRRNAFGRQSDSFEIDLEIPAIEAYGPNPATGSLKLPGVFIRAPVIEAVHDEGVQVIAKLQGREGREGEIVAVKQGNVLGSSFHPELTGDVRFHQLFVDICLQNKKN